MRMSTRYPAVAGLVLATLLTIQPGWSQESRATVLGRVTDSSGSVIPAAAVEFTNLGTGVTVKTGTNGEGNYFSSFLNPGSYRVTAGKEGFKRTVRDAITLSVGGRVELNLTLEIGALAESVMVTADVSLLETANATLGRVVSTEEVRSLPINHGNVDNLIRLGTGVGFTDDPAKDQPWEPLNTAYAMAGSVSSRNEFTLDGASNTLHDEARGSIAQAWAPISDVVAEFKVQTATFDVSTGQTQGGVVNVSLKSGTNQFHGSAFWSKQTPGMNANVWFSNRAGQPRADSKYNRVGGMFSGPVLLPKLYNGKNRTFFLVAYEYVKSVLSSGGILATVPTAAQRNGDFSALLKLGSNYQIYDPFTRAAAAGGRFANQPLANNIIPPSLISPIAKNIISYYPLPEQAGTADGGNNLDRSNWPRRTRFHSTLYKFDHNLSDRNRLMFRINTQRNDNNSVDYFGFDNPSQGAVFWQESASFAFSENYSFSPSFVMDLRIGDSSFVRAQGPSTGKDFQISSLGFPASLQNAIAPFYREFPTVTINGYTALGNRTPLHKLTETRDATATFFKAAGSHQVKFGGEFRFYPDNRTAGSTSTPTLLTLTEAYTRGPFDNSPASLRGQALAALLFGIPTGGSLTVPSAQDFAESNRVWAGFVQDDWKITRKLNVNFGVRYELETPLSERFNRTVRGFDTSAVQPFEAQALANYAKSPTPEISASQFSVRGGLTFAGVGGQPHGVYDADTNNFMPRAGFAYSPDPRTVIRGGFGMYFGSLGIRQSDVIQPGYTQTTQIVPSNDGGVTFAATLANPFPNGFLRPTGNSLGPLTSVGNSIAFFNPQPAAPRLMKYELDIQRELPGRFVLSVGYLGSRGNDLEVSRALSALPNQYLSKSPARDQAAINYLSANLPNPFSGIPQFSGTGLAGAVIPRSALLAPYPQFGGVSFYTYDGKSSYDALNVKFEKRFSHGYLVSMTYTFSKFIEATALLNAGDTAPVRAISTQDFPHHAAFSAIYELPFGRGRKFAPKLGRVPQALLGGWDTSYIYTYQSGPPIPFGNVILKGSLKDVPLPDNQRSAERWFNTGAFNTSNAEQLGANLVAFSPRFNGIRSEAYNSWDMSLLKHMKFHEQRQLEFRAEALNVLNQVTFGVPNTTPNSTIFGQVTAQRNVPRRLQLTLRLQF